MSTNTPDQQITLASGGDAANLPLALTDMIADVETRLVLKYTNEADRTARHTTPIEGDFTDLATENREDVYDGSVYVSAHARGLFTNVRKTANQTFNNDTSLANITDLVSTLPTVGSFGWRAVIFYDSSTTADAKFAFTWPAGATARWGLVGLATAAAATTGDGQFATTSASGNSIPVGGAAVGTVLMTVLEGEIIMGGTGGNLQLQAAQQTLDATVTTIRDRSRLQVWRFA